MITNDVRNPATRLPTLRRMAGERLDHAVAVAMMDPSPENQREFTAAGRWYNELWRQHGPF